MAKGERERERETHREGSLDVHSTLLTVYEVVVIVVVEVKEEEEEEEVIDEHKRPHCNTKGEVHEESIEEAARTTTLCEVCSK